MVTTMAQYGWAGLEIAVVTATQIFWCSSKSFGAHLVLTYGDAYNGAGGPVDAVWFGS